MENRSCIAIDLKSFYASVECVERGLDPLVANHTVPETDREGLQLDLFEEAGDDPRERSRQEAILAIRKKFGKNAILKGMDFEDGAAPPEFGNCEENV